MLKQNERQPKSEEHWTEQVSNLAPGESLRFQSNASPRLMDDLRSNGLVHTATPGLLDWPKKLARLSIWHEATKPMDLNQCRLSPEEEALVHALKVQGKIRFRARGGSMRPFVPDGSMVEIFALSPDDTPTIGSILLIAQPKRTVLHRLIEIVDTSRGRAFLCRGDRVPHFDRPVWRDAILGIYRGPRK